MDGTNNPTEELRDAIRTELANHPGLQALNELLVEAADVSRRKGLSRNTAANNKHIDKYQEPGRRKLLMRLEDVSVLKNRKRGEK